MTENGPHARTPGWPAGSRRLLMAIAAAAVLATLLLLLLPRLRDLRPRLTAEEAAELAIVTLQRESREAFVITGSLELTAETQVRNVRRLLPGLLDMSLGTVESTVRAPGRVSYGFRVEDLAGGDFNVHGDTIEIRVPSVRVYSVEPDLESMEVSTTAGWLRVREGTQLAVQQRATALVTDVLRRQAEQHLADSEQPRINTAQTLAQLLRPAFQAYGLRDPVFRFVLTDELSYTTERSSR